MPAEVNLITQTDLHPEKTIYFTRKFNEGITALQDVLGVTNVIPVREGMVIYPLTSVTTTLQDGEVAEGDIIPLSKVETTKGDPVEIVLKKWRKATSAEAIARVGRDVAINMTDEALIREIQKEVRNDLLAYLGTGTGTATGVGLQATMAQAYAQTTIKFEDNAFNSVAMINPLDLADYLGNAQVTLQNAFGLTYLQNFLGFDVVLVLSTVPKGTVYATAQDNLQLYKVDMNSSEVAKEFNLRADRLGLVGMTHYLTHERAQSETLIMSGIYLIAERLDGIIKATITDGA